MQTLYNDNPLGTRATLGGNLAKINANFAECEQRLSALEEAVPGTDLELVQDLEDPSDDAVPSAGAVARALSEVGVDPTFATRLTALELAMAGINQLPAGVPGTATVFDSATVTGNLLSGFTDPDDDPLSISALIYAGLSRAVGAAFATQYGTLTVSANGAYTYVTNSTARALRDGQTATDVVNFSVSDGRGGIKASLITFTVVGTNNVPIVVSEDRMVSAGLETPFNLLANDIDPEGETLTVTRFSIAGDSSTYTTPATVNISGVMSITINADGSGVVTPASDFTGAMPVITYTVSDGELTSTGTVNLAVQVGPASAFSNPVTTRRTDAATIYDVYDEEDFDAVPWGTLGSDTIVNIHHKDEPYKRKIGLRANGTFAKPVVIWGVTDDEGNRPILDGNGAITAPLCNQGGSNNVFTTTPDYGESLGVIVIKRGTSDAYTSKPQHIHIKNFEIRGARKGATYTTLAGATVSYNVAAGIYVFASRYPVLENNVITDNGFGIFTQAKDGELSQAPEYVTMRSNRIYANGIANSYLEHNVYVQAHMVVTEGNYIGQLRAGALGSSYKSRSSGEVIRFNYIEAAARAIDLVHSEDQDVNGIVTQPEWGIAHVYGNIIVNDKSLPQGGSYVPVHFGGDNLGEEDDSGTSISPTVRAKYRTVMYFWGNTYFTRNTGEWRTILFDLSTIDTVVHAWDNVFIINSSSHTQVSWTEWCGEINFYGKNAVFSSVTLLNARADAAAGRTTINQHGTFITGDPMPLDIPSKDFSPALLSSVLGEASGVPESLVDEVGEHPLTLQPMPGTNGMAPRENADDLGALHAVDLEQVTPTGVAGGGGGGGENPGGGGGGGMDATDGVWLFGEADGTLLASGTGWVGLSNLSTERYEVVDGALQCLAGTGSNGEAVYYSNGQGSSHASNALLAAPIPSGSTLRLLLNVGASGHDGYFVLFTATTWEYRRNNVWTSSGALPSGLSGATRVIFEHDGTTLTASYGGTELFSVTDSTPLEGGYPGFSMGPGSVVANMRFMEWRDTVEE